MLKLLFSLLITVITLAAGANIGRRNITAEQLTDLFYDKRIVGGHDVNITQYPHQISLRFKNILCPECPYRHRCGGSIISDTMIVTAAHCIIATVPSQFNVVAGTNLRQGNGYIAPVEKIIMHEGYQPSTTDNDIALLILKTALPLDNITMKAIALTETAAKHGVTATVTGWGTTVEQGSPSEFLQAVQVPVVSNDLCNEDYNGQITDSMLCAGLRGIGGKDACQGDSGGPLVIKGKLAGVVSWGDGCARPEYPGVYANVYHLRSWLLQKIDENRQ